MERHSLSLTAMETQVLETLIANLYAEPGFSDVDAHDISRATGIPTKSIRGVLSSLVKKDIIWLDETNNWGTKDQYVIIYLSPAYWYLHPQWKNESVDNA
jgi:hypothetical protein